MGDAQSPAGASAALCDPEGVQRPAGPVPELPAATPGSMSSDSRATAADQPRKTPTEEQLAAIHRLAQQRTTWEQREERVKALEAEAEKREKAIKAKEARLGQYRR